MYSFANVLMSLFPNNSQDTRNNEQIEEISRYDINLRNINGSWERGRNNSNPTDEQVNPSSSSSLFNANANESYDMVTTEIIDRHSKADRAELSTQRSRDVASTSENNRETPDVDNERNNYSEDENPNESSDDMLVNNRKRILKRKFSLPVLSDISDDSINEPRRMRRRRVRPLVESSEENILEHGDEILEITRPSHSRETCKGAEQNKRALSDSSIVNVRETKHTQRKTTERCQAPLSRVPIPVNSTDSTENEDELQETETKQESQCLNQNDGSRTLSRIRSCNNQSEHHRTRSSLQRIFDFSETRRVQEALRLRFLENYNSSNQVENEGTNPPESSEWNTLRLINKYSDESDPDWEPPESEPEDTDINSSDAIESDSSYEVQIPERTWDLLER
ncbi:suppressor of Mek1-like [Centruroides sculpturatus]|uniref:suppressor of Mek1-like n=1 Tax=Centruroides sculpturatus TaxID=218467 RepID=UPI000C6F00D0|nr:suppressor of Mek1-like [Centruroides sculpturatus]